MARRNVIASTAIIGPNVTLSKKKYVPLKLYADKRPRGIRVGEQAVLDGPIYLGKRVKIGHGATIKGRWVIEDDVLIDDRCMLVGEGHIQTNAKIRYAAELIGSIDLERDVKINGSTLYKRVKIGKGSNIIVSRLGTFPVGTQDIEIGENNAFTNASLYGMLKMGDRNRVNDATLGAPPPIQDKRSLDSYLLIGDGNIITESSSIQGAPTRERATRVGNDCEITAQTHIAHDCVLEDHVIFITGSQIAGHVHIGEYAMISGKTGASQFVHIGPYVQTEGGLNLTQDVLPYFRGDPQENKTFNKIGLQRAGVGKKHIKEIKEAYSILFNPDYERAQSLEKLVEFAKTLRDPRYVNRLITFIQESDADTRRKLYIHKKDMKDSRRTRVDKLTKRMWKIEHKFEELEEAKRKTLLRKVYSFLKSYLRYRRL